MKLLNNSSIAGFLVGGTVCLTLCLTIGFCDSVAVKNQRPLVSSTTITPEVPLSANFCDKEIDLTLYNRHESMDRELSTFTYYHATTMLLIKRANRVFPIIEPILKANGIPDDFKYLAVIESHLDSRVTSPARAVGMWQFMEGTAKQYGLTVTPTIDERCHVTKATEAACRYLKAAYAKYGDWATVAASYNAGMGKISGELTKQKVENSLDLWLVEETTRYVYRILAIKRIFEAPYKYGFVMKAEDLYKPIDCQEVTISTDILDLALFAQEYEITYADLKRFNPWLRDRKLLTLGKSYQLLIPKKDALYYKKPNSYVHNPAWVVK